jgi:hypothetical protein
MRYLDHEPQLPRLPVQSGSRIKSARLRFNQILMQRCMGRKPGWVHLPDRVWRRNSALLMCIHERKHFDG